MADVAARIAAAVGDPAALLVLAIELAQANAQLEQFRARATELEALDRLRLDQDAERKRARRARAPDPCPALRAAVLERDGWQCVQCEAVSDLHIDHVVPVARGGLTTLENLQTLCCTCNLRKGARCG